MGTINIEVDGKQLEAQPGEMLIQVTDRNDIYIPRFCYHEKLSIAANCRMCLIEVARAPKPLPACATPVMDGMKVFTKSEYARDAQKGTMEFLLINHPLDCPVCDQGGECPLQDQAMGYGGDDSRYVEKKRAVPSHDIGPLIATEMTRCIHCTRCVRFGEEVAGVMEMGAPGRGEFVKISTFLNQSIDSEVSGNIIDLCPVGALTSKPYRFSARSWELRNQASISPYDCLGSNINIQILRDEVERVLPIENPKINDCWLSDRDRFSYEAVNSENRLTQPMIKEGGGWKETDWETALNHATAGLKTVIESGSASDIGGLAAATATLEEFHLFQKLIRGIGSENVDHRLQQVDFRDDINLSTPLSEIAIENYHKLTTVILIGSNIRKEQPLLSLRIRNGVIKAGTNVSTINPMDFDFNFDLAEKQTASGVHLVHTLAGLAASIAHKQSLPLPDEIKDIASDNTMSLSADNIISASKNGLIVLGALAQQHTDAALLKSICRWICQNTGCKLAILAPANSAAAYQANCLPGAAGKNASEMIDQGLRGCILLGTEPELDCINGRSALRAMQQCEFVVQLSAFKSESVMQYADVLLPMAAFTESAGTFVNCEDKRQQSKVATTPKGEARPGWKILRVLGNFLQCDGFNQVSLDDVTAEIPTTLQSAINNDQTVIVFPTLQSIHNAPSNDQNLFRVVDMPMYRGDVTLRHANALQKTADNPAPVASINPALAEKRQLSEGDSVKVQNEAGSIQLSVSLNPRVNEDSVYIPAGFMETTGLGGHGFVTVEKV